MLPRALFLVRMPAECQDTDAAFNQVERGSFRAVKEHYSELLKEGLR